MLSCNIVTIEELVTKWRTQGVGASSPAFNILCLQSHSDLLNTACTQRYERLSRMVPQIKPDLTVKNTLRRERHNWVTGTGTVEDLQGGRGDHNESIHWNRLE